MKTKTHHRSVEIKHHANQAKVGQIEDLTRWFISACAVCKTEKIRHLRAGGKLQRFIKRQWKIGKPDVFSARMFKSVENIVDASLRSWQELAVIAGRGIISEWRKQDNRLSNDDFIALYALNKAKRWWDTQAEYPEHRAALITEILKRNPFPVLDGKTITLDSIVCDVVEAEQSKHETWLEIRGFRGTRIALPVERTSYFNAKVLEGKECRVTQLHLDHDGRLVIHRVVEKTNVPIRQEGKDIGIDWGLNNLVATTDGQLLGLALYPWLKERDEELLALTKSLQRQGIKPRSSRRFRSLQRRIRQYVKNEVGRVLNRLAEQDIRSITCEDLDFRGKGLSRRTRVIVSRAGRSAFKQKLADLTESHGIEVHKVNPAYTSKQCSGCGLVADRQRKGSSFQCLHCGKRMHSDVNAARNIIGRRSAPDDGFHYWSKESILEYLNREFGSTWGQAPDLILKRHDALTAGLPGTARCKPGGTSLSITK